MGPRDAAEAARKLGVSELNSEQERVARLVNMREKTSRDRSQDRGGEEAPKYDMAKLVRLRLTANEISSIQRVRVEDNLHHSAQSINKSHFDE
jgi:hypothetical protein